MSDLRDTADSAPSTDRLPLSMENVVGSAPALVRLFETIDRIAKTECPVLITGESGTGKDLVARALHRHSLRSEGPLVKVNCAAFPRAILESELFGHVQGASSEGRSPRMGRIHAAAGGTLFLDNVTDMPLSLQVKLLRVLQYQEYSPAGDGRVLSADIRVVAATTIDQDVAVREGKFREDLHRRLAAVRVGTPSLLSRSQDMPALVDHFFERAQKRLGRDDLSGFSGEAEELIRAHDWPGNVSELESAVEWAVLHAAGPKIEPEDLALHRAGHAESSAFPSSGTQLTGDAESCAIASIQHALERTQWNEEQAAVLLGITRTALAEMMKRKRIERAA